MLSWHKIIIYSRCVAASLFNNPTEAIAMTIAALIQLLKDAPKNVNEANVEVI